MLVEALQDLTESQLNRWLTHSRTLRLSVVERLADEAEWNAFVAFVERYGTDLFTQKFLNLGNLRAILHQRTIVWLSNLEEDPDADDLRLVSELGSTIPRDDAAKWLTLAIEAVVENYREYRDYNTTTTHSDHGELLYTLVDFLRLRAAYDRVAWNLQPVVMAHEILVRHNRPPAAELWQQALAERTAETADANLARFDELCDAVRHPPAQHRRAAQRAVHAAAGDRSRAGAGRPGHRRRRNARSEHRSPRCSRKSPAWPRSRPAPASTCPIGSPPSKKKSPWSAAAAATAIGPTTPRADIEQVRLELGRMAAANRRRCAR